jgi:hypothetical protein
MPRAHHLQAESSAVHEAQGHRPHVAAVIIYLFAGGSTSADKPSQMLRGLARPGLPMLGCINPEEAYACAIDRDGIPINDSNLCSGRRGQECEEYEGTKHGRLMHRGWLSAALVLGRSRFYRLQPLDFRDDATPGPGALVRALIRELIRSAGGEVARASAVLSDYDAGGSLNVAVGNVGHAGSIAWCAGRFSQKMTYAIFAAATRIR